MKKIIYTCDSCQKRLPEEPEIIFTFPVYWGYKCDEMMSKIDYNRIIIKEYMLCPACRRAIAEKLLDLNIMSI